MSLIKLATAETHGATGARLRSIGFVVLGAALLCLSAKVKVPLYLVPVTLQTLAVMALAIAYGPRHAMASVALYIVLGAVGLPVFAETPERGVAGLGYLVGPTGGYLVGFVIAAGVVALLSQGRGPVGRVLAMLAGLVVIYTPGVLWLMHFVGSFHRAFLIGALRLMPGDLLKIALMVAVLSVCDLHGAIKGTA